MTTEEKINVAANILSENNSGGFFSSRFDKKRVQKFREIFSFGFEDDACQAFAEDTIDKLFDAAVYALNNGFDGNSVNLINGLLECALATSGEKAAKKLEKIRQQRKNVIAAAKAETKMPDRIKKHVTAYVSTSVQFAQIQIDRWKEDTVTKRNFVKSIEKLNEIQKLVDDALDGNSVKAAVFAHSIDEKIIAWRKGVSEGICTDKELAVLDDALEIGREWNASLKNGKAASEKKDIYEYAGKDKVAAVVNSYNFSKGSIASYQDQYDLRYSQIEEIDEKIAQNERAIAAQNDVIADAKEKALAIRKDMLNGRKDENTANIELAPYVRRIKDAQERIVKLQNDKARNAAQRAVKKDRLWLLKTVLDKYEENKNMPVELMASISKIDMNTVLNVVDGVADKETAREVEDMMIELQALDLAKIDYGKAVDEVLGRIKEDEEKISSQYENIYNKTETEEERTDGNQFANIAEIDKILGFTDGQIDEIQEDQKEKEKESVQSENKAKERFRSFGDSDR